jgi:hypothetical protein
MMTSKEHFYLVKLLALINKARADGVTSPACARATTAAKCNS